MVEEARGYTCPVCGAPADEKMRSCGFCRAPIATLRCTHCFHMNIVEAVHCSGCGRQLGLSPAAEAGDLSCPDCHRAMHVLRGGAGCLFDCHRCGGQFVEHALTQELLERRESLGLHATVKALRQNPLEQKVRYIPCPSCRQMMNRKNFGQRSGIIVDVCPQHGIWFDAGELPRVLAFVQSGGLERERLRAGSPRGEFVIHGRVSNADPDVGLIVDLGQAGLSLLEFVAGLLKD